MRFLADMGVSITTVHALRAATHDAAHLHPRLFRGISDCASELASGAMIIVEAQGYRVRRLPIRR